jgi:hypothetical protein
MEALPRRRNVGAGGSVSGLTGSWSGEDGWEGETSDEWAPAASDTEKERATAAGDEVGWAAAQEGKRERNLLGRPEFG